MDYSPPRSDFSFEFFCLRADFALESIPPVRQWKELLLDRYLDICPIHSDHRLPGVSTPGFRLDSFKIYWDKLLERSNFMAPLISFAKRKVVEQFLRVLIHRGILEEVANPCKLIFHPVIVIPKKETGKLRLVIDSEL